MKDHRYANRGMTFEQLIEYANAKYRADKEAVVTKQHTKFIPIRDGRGQVKNVKVCEKATVDYLGRVGLIPVAAEAKHSSTDTIRFDAVQEHQVAFLSDFMGDGEGLSLVLVSFKLERFYAVPWPFWEAARNAWIKNPKSKETVTYEGQTWTTPGKASVHPEELLPEWEIKIGGSHGLDYLRRYNR